MLADGCSSIPFFVLLKSKSQSSSWVSLEKSASTAPARVPVASKVEEVLGDQAKVAVLGTSRSPTIADTIDNTQIRDFARRIRNVSSSETIFSTESLRPLSYNQIFHLN